MATQRELHNHLESEVSAIRAVQKDIARSHKMLQQYGAQLNENEMVQKELSLLDSDSKVFKLIGPVLVPQDLVEAKSNVDKRLEYINSEIKRLESTLKELEQKQAAKQQDVLLAQQRLQASQAPRRP